MFFLFVFIELLISVFVSLDNRFAAFQCDFEYKKASEDKRRKFVRKFKRKSGWLVNGANSLLKQSDGNSTKKIKFHPMRWRTKDLSRRFSWFHVELQLDSLSRESYLCNRIRASQIFFHESKQFPIRNKCSVFIVIEFEFEIKEHIWDESDAKSNLQFHDFVCSSRCATFKTWSEWRKRGQKLGLHALLSHRPRLNKI